MADTVWRAIYCPGETHREPLSTAKGVVEKSPKILLLYNDDGEIMVQCGDMRCRHSGRPHYNGWHKIRLRDGGYDVTKMPATRFETVPTSGVVIQG